MTDAWLDQLPTEKKDDDQKAKRKELFGSFDPNGNGYLSLAEVDKGIAEQGAAADLPKPVIMRAFQAANGIAQENGKNRSKHGCAYIEFSEFRLFLVYLKRYHALFKIFDDIDTGSDRRIDIEEFKTALDKLQIENVDDAQVEFNAIDTNGGGQILFDEFATWALKKTQAEETDEEL